MGELYIYILKTRKCMKLFLRPTQQENLSVDYTVCYTQFPIVKGSTICLLGQYVS